MSMWKSALATSKNSATHLTANVTIVFAGILEAISQCGDQIVVTAGEFLQDPDLKAQLKAMIPGKWWPLALVGMMVLIKVARNRTLTHQGK